MSIQKTLVPLCLVIAVAGGCRIPWAASQEAAGKTSSGPFGQLVNPLDWGADQDEPRAGTPERVVATWVDTVRQQPGQPAERGFGGRIYFHDRETDPITVDGRLVVYAFDEDGRDPTDHKPTRRYVFPAPQLAKHMSTSEIGPSYSVWLPWGTADGPATQVSLIARFEPTEGGGLVVSDQAKQRLPGRGLRSPDSDRQMLAEDSGGGAVRQATFNERSTKPSAAVKGSEPDELKRRMSTTTISLPKR